MYLAMNFGTPGSKVKPKAFGGHMGAQHKHHGESPVMQRSVVMDAIFVIVVILGIAAIFK